MFPHSSVDRSKVTARVALRFRSPSKRVTPARSPTVANEMSSWASSSCFISPSMVVFEENMYSCCQLLAENAFHQITSDHQHQTKEAWHRTTGSNVLVNRSCNYKSRATISQGFEVDHLENFSIPRTLNTRKNACAFVSHLATWNVWYVCMAHIRLCRGWCNVFEEKYCVQKIAPFSAPLLLWRNDKNFTPQLKKFVFHIDRVELLSSMRYYRL